MTDAVECDVLIVGGGLVGSALAAALAGLPIRIVLVEARDPRSLEQPSFDSRVTALARGSQRILSAIGVWEALQRDAEPIKSIHISERGRFGAARIRAEEEGVPALGYTIENRGLGQALWGAIADAEHCRVLAPARLQHFEPGAECIVAHVVPAGTDAAAAASPSPPAASCSPSSPSRPASSGRPASADTVKSSPKPTTVRARLLVAADGADSPVREALDIARREDLYRQQAIVVNCATDVAHGGAAFERFTTEGPLAMLPLTRGRLGAVWTLPAEKGAAIAALPADDFRAALQEIFGHRLGSIVRVGERLLHPLRRVRSNALGTGRVLLIGNAAVNLHPVAGQGFNLALRDVAALAEIVADAAREGWPGDFLFARRYQEWRVADQRRVAWFTHGLVSLFGMSAPGFGACRGLGLVGFDRFPGAKATLARHTMGIAGKLPRLARGLPLR